MFEVIIGYLLITAVIYSVTRDNRKSFSWPASLIVFVYEKVTSGIKSIKNDS
jgi:hypothetical protein